jgi:predicted Zn-dependent protease
VCRQAEHEADAIGIRLLAKACYDPRANLSMLYKLEQQEKQSGDGDGLMCCCDGECTCHVCCWLPSVMLTP